MKGEWHCALSTGHHNGSLLSSYDDLLRSLWWWWWWLLPLLNGHICLVLNFLFFFSTKLIGLFDRHDDDIMTQWQWNLYAYNIYRQKLDKFFSEFVDLWYNFIIVYVFFQEDIDLFISNRQPLSSQFMHVYIDDLFSIDKHRSILCIGCLYLSRKKTNVYLVNWWFTIKRQKKNRNISVPII